MNLKNIDLRSHKLAFLTLVFLGLLFQGCATQEMRQFAAVSQRPGEYERFFKYLDKAADKAGVRDASTFPVPGFPYLRTDRFLLGMRDRIVNEAQKQAWVQSMLKHGLDAREKEVKNLPDSVLGELASRLGEPPDRKTMIETIKSYSKKSLSHDQNKTDFYDALKAAQRIPDEYSIIMRTFSDNKALIPLTSSMVDPFSAVDMPKPGTIFNTSVRFLAPMLRISFALMTVAIAGAFLARVARRVAITSSSSSKNRSRSSAISVRSSASSWA